MTYPDDFDTSAFVAGKRVAISRIAGIWIMVALFFIVACCIALPWLQQNQRVNPFIIYVNGSHGEWDLIGKRTAEDDISYYFSMQRALVGVFTEKWFTISGNAEQNNKNWSTCNRETVCGHGIANTFWNENGCDIYCMSGENMYQTFATTVLPIYETQVSFGERWYVDTGRMSVTPNGKITENGGTWVVRAHVRSNLNGDFDIIAYAKVVRNTTGQYPQTLGYYITGFNSYRIQ